MSKSSLPHKDQLKIEKLHEHIADYVCRIVYDAVHREEADNYQPDYCYHETLDELLVQIFVDHHAAIKKLKDEKTASVSQLKAAHKKLAKLQKAEDFEKDWGIPYPCK